MDCAEIRQAFMNGGVPSGPAQGEHLKECVHCAELIGNAAELGRRLAGAAPRIHPDVPEQLALTESLIARERGLRAFLRSRSTRARWLLTLTLPVVLLVRELLSKPLWRELDTSRVFAGLLLLGLLGLIARSALRPPAIQGCAARVRSLFAFVAWCVPCVLWFAPETPGGNAGDITGSGFALRSLTCFGYGSALAAPSFALLWAFDRGERVSFRVWALAAGLVAVLSSLILLLHCPSTQLAHLICGHFSIGLSWFFAVSLATWWRRDAH